MKQSSKLYKPHPLIQSLKNNQITNVLGEGFAMIFHNQPQFPITYLSQYLLNYVKNKNQSQKLQQYRQRIENIKSQTLKEQQQIKLNNQERQNQKLKQKNRNNEFKKQIQKQKEPKKFLNKFCTWLQQNLDLSAIYIGQLKYPNKQIPQNDMTELAHLDNEQPKRIQYIASSQTQQHIIVGKSLKTDSLTGTLFQKKEQNQQNNDQQQKNKDEEKERYNFVQVPNVIKDNRMTYLRYPKLGAYLGVLMPIKSYLNQNSFQVGYQNTLKNMKDKQQLQKQIQRKQAQFRQQYEQKARNDVDEKQLEQMELNFQKQKEALVLEEVQIPYQQIQFVVCADTLGLQKQISSEAKKQIFEYITILKNSWQNRQNQRIKQDINNQVTYQQLFQNNLQQTIQKIIENQQKDPEDMAEFERFKANQKQYQFEIDSSKLQKIKELLIEEKYQNYYTFLTSMNVLRFQPLMQMILYFLGYKKQQINIPETNVLDWNRIKGTLCNQFLIDRLVQYNHRGAKPQKVQSYSKWVRILQVLQKIDYTAVLNYNLAYGALLKYMLMTAKLRKIDAQLRRQKLTALKAARQQKIKENQRLNEQKQRIRQQQRAALEGNEQNPFDEQAWEAQYVQQHPLIEVQLEYEQEIDNDLEEGEAQQVQQQQQ